MAFSQQEYWSGLPFPPPGHLPDRISCTAGRFFAAKPLGKLQSFRFEFAKDKTASEIWTIWKKERPLFFRSGCWPETWMDLRFSYLFGRMGKFCFAAEHWDSLWELSQRFLRIAAIFWWAFENHLFWCPRLRGLQSLLPWHFSYFPLLFRGTFSYFHYLRVYSVFLILNTVLSEYLEWLFFLFSSKKSLTVKLFNKWFYIFS